MSLVPTNYTAYASASDTRSFLGSATAYVRLNYISMVSSGTFGISLYFNQGSTSLVNIRSNNGYGIFSNAQTGGSLTGSFNSQSTNNNTYYTTNNYSSNLYGVVGASVGATDDNPFGFGSPLTPNASITFLLQTINLTNMFTVNSTVGYYMFILPAASTNIGRIFFVKNFGNTNYCSVSTTSSSEVIDGYSLNQVQLTNGQCIGLAAISSTTWSILTFISNTGSLTVQSLTLGSATTITSNIVVSSISANNTAVNLPDPSSWGKGNILMLNFYNSVSGSSPYIAQVYALGFLANSTSTGGSSVRVTIAADLSGYYNHNVSMLLLSDGTKWHLAGYFNGSGCIFDNNNNYLPGAGATSNGIVSHVSYGWVTTHSQAVSSGYGRLYFTKMTNVAGPAYGIIVENILTPATYGYIGYPTGWGRVYKNSSGNVNYSGFAMVQANISGNTVHFPLSMYPSLY